VKRLLSGGLFALFVVLVFEALALFGVISLLAGHIAVFLAWIVGAVLTSTDIIPGKRVPHKVVAILGLAVVLVALDLWAIHAKQELETKAAEKPATTPTAVAQPAPPPTAPNGPAAPEPAHKPKKLPPRKDQ